MSKIPVWMDCDTGTDDSVAIMLATYLKEIDLLGISTAAGNRSRKTLIGIPTASTGSSARITRSIAVRKSR